MLESTEPFDGRKLDVSGNELRGIVMHETQGRNVQVRYLAGAHGALSPALLRSTDSRQHLRLQLLIAVAN